MIVAATEQWPLEQDKTRHLSGMEQFRDYYDKCIAVHNKV